MRFSRVNGTPSVRFGMARLTTKGLDLYPALAVKAWGEKWGGFQPAEERSTRKEPIWFARCRHQVRDQVAAEQSRRHAASLGR